MARKKHGLVVSTFKEAKKFSADNFQCTNVTSAEVFFLLLCKPNGQG